MHACICGKEIVGAMVVVTDATASDDGEVDVTQTERYHANCIGLIWDAARNFLHGEDPPGLDLAALADALGVDRADVAALAVTSPHSS